MTESTPGRPSAAATEQPAPRQAPTRGTGPALRRFWPYVRPHRRWLWIGLLMIPVVAGVSALRPLLVKHAIDSDIAGGDVILVVAGGGS